MEIICEKCVYNSGDDWSQCLGACPMEYSPHYDPNWREYTLNPIPTEIKDEEIPF